MFDLKSVTKSLSAFAAGGFMLLSAHQAQALVIEGSYSVNVNTGSGLVIQTQDLLSNPFSGNLALGVSQSFNLFRIWTNETFVNAGEDNIAQAASVNWNFTAPVGSGNSVGATSGGYAFFNIFQFGEIQWNNPETVSFANGAELEISLSNELFNEGIFGLNPGYNNGDIVIATFELTKDANTITNSVTINAHPIPVPEPASLALLGTGLLGIGLLVRRRRRRD